MKKKKRSKLGISFAPNRAFFKELVLALAVIFVWRGVWNLMDKHFLPGYPILSNIISILIGLFLLYLPDDELKIR